MRLGIRYNIPNTKEESVIFAFILLLRLIHEEWCTQRRGTGMLHITFCGSDNGGCHEGNQVTTLCILHTNNPFSTTEANAEQMLLKVFTPRWQYDFHTPKRRGTITQNTVVLTI